MATSISQMQKRGICIEPPLINKAELGFKADEEHNSILFALKSISDIGDDVVEAILKHRPFTSMDDFYEKMIETKMIKPSKMTMLIKAGCFDAFEKDRIHLLKTYIKKYRCKFIDKLTLSQILKMQDLHFKYKELNLIPQRIEDSIRIFNFYKYTMSLKVVEEFIDPTKKKIPKCGYHDEIIELDNIAMEFFISHYSEDSIYDIRDQHYLIFKKKFVKETQEKIEELIEYIGAPETLKKYNEGLSMEIYDAIGIGTVSHMEMESLCIYIHEHELKGLDYEKFNLVNFFNLPEEPQVSSYYTRKIKKIEDGKEIQEIKKFPKYCISKICGTVLDKNKDRHTVTILTPEGVVNVKYAQGSFLHYNKKISQQNTSGKKKVIEDSWFKRGNLIMVTGYRKGDMFRCYNYADTIFKHTTSLITEINEDDVVIKTERED